MMPLTQATQHLKREATQLRSSNTLALLRAKPVALPALLLFLVHLAITLTLAFRLNIWLDEAYTLRTTGSGINYAFRQAITVELQPPLYFVLLSLWRKLDSSVFFARLPSVLAIAATLYCVIKLARRYFPKTNPYMILALVAFNPFIIWAAAEMRLYAFAVLLSALLLLLFHDGFLAEVTRARARSWYILVAVLALYTQYFLGFLLVANACALLSLRRWRQLASYLRAMCVVALLFAPMASMVFSQVAAHKTGFGDAPSLAQSVGIIFWRAQEYLLPVAWSPLYIWRRWLLRFAFVPLLVLLWQRRQRITSEQIAVWTITVALFLCFVAALRVTSEALMQDRHTAALFLPAMLASVSVCTIFAKRRVMAAWLFLSLLFYTASLSATYQPLAKRGDWERVAAFISTEERENQPILILPGYNELPFAYYYHGANRIVPLSANASQENNGHELPALTKQFQIALAQTGDAPSQLWLITDDRCEAGSRDAICGEIDEMLRENYEVESRAAFHHSYITLFRRKDYCD